MSHELVGVRLRVVGAGVSGLAAAVIAAEKGARVEIVEEREDLGGLLAPHLVRGVACDLGSHRLHRDALAHPTVARLLAPIAPETRPRRGVLLFRGRRIPYPPTWLDLARGLGVAGLSFGASFLRNGGRWERERIEARDDVGFEDFVRSRVGEAAYRSFYRPYVEKVWGVEASALSQTVAKSRVSTTSPWRLIGKRSGRSSNEFLYPRAGMSSFVAHLVERARALGVVFRKRTRVDLRDDGVDRDRGSPWRILFSGRLRDLAPDAGFEHRGVHLVHLVLPVDRVGDFETYYAPEPCWWFGRVSELRNYSPSLGRRGETILCVEIPEGRWGRDARFDRAPELDELLAQLRRAEILPRGVNPIEISSRFVPDVYPIYDREWIARWERAMTDVCRDDVLPFGRQGLFLHCNVDACIAMADDVVDHVARGGGGRRWHERARGFLGLRVRD